MILLICFPFIFNIRDVSNTMMICEIIHFVYECENCSIILKISM
jgi:hypothetical protein